MRLSFVLVVVLALATPLSAGERYRMPPKAIASLVDAPQTPAVSLGPDNKTLAILEIPSHPPIAEVAQPELRLAGLRINPRTSSPSRQRYYSGLALLDVTAARPRPRPIAGLPRQAKISWASWSPDGSRLAFTVTDTDVRLWIADIARATAAPAGSPALNAAAGNPCSWLADSRSLVCLLVPAQRAAEPQLDPVPGGPIVQESNGVKKPARTYQDMLKSPHDEAVFEHYVQAQVALVGVDGAVKLVGKPGLIVDVAPSPDGAWLFVKTLHRPWSYRVPMARFPHRAEIWNLAGKVARLIADNPLKEDVPVDFAAVPTGPRAFEWRADADATMCWAEARDGGDPKRKAAVRDEVLCLAAPFRGKPARLAALALRYGGTTWGTGQIALVEEWWWNDRKTRTWIVAPDQRAAKPRVLWDRSFEDRYGDPGRPVVGRTPRGTWTLVGAADGAIFLDGEGASSEGDRPFLDRLDLRTLESKRLWRSEAPYYESVQHVVDATRVITRRESVSEPPQYYLRALGHGAARKPVQLTSFPHPSPQLAKVKKQLLRYRRADGVELTGMLYLPPGYDPKKQGPLPVLMWAYPQEFKSAEAASQVQGSPHRFVRVSAGGPLFALTQGYAVLDDPAFPIVGEGSTQPNDTYVRQLVSSAQAAIDELVRLGVGDRDRMAIGGHSYGAFTTANLLAHSDLFRAGIGRSGAYNRTLTPFGFQSEERTFWEAPKTYMEMSPFANADKINEPLLIIHGEADNNSGTFPMQSERLFEALKGLGGRARLVMLPAESHGYRARESVMHMLWEMTAWLDAHVKKAPRRGHAR